MNQIKPTGNKPPNNAGGYTQGSVNRHIFKLSSVMIFAFLAMTLGGLIEVFYLGMVGKDELAAITFTFPVAMSLNALARGIGMGAASLIAQAMGKKLREQAALLINHCYLLVIIFTIFLAFVAQWFGPLIFSSLGASGRVLELTIDYMQVWLIGFPMMGLAMTSNGMIRAFGNALFPGYIMTLGPAIQVLLGPFLIFGWFGLPAMGIVGAAWAFVVASICQILLASLWFIWQEKLLRPTLNSFTQSSYNILHVGIPAAATNMIQPLSAAVVTWLIAGYCNTVVAGFGVASRIEAVVAMVVIGIAASVVPLVGQNWGAGQYQRVFETLRSCYIACLIWGFMAAGLMWIGADFFIQLINDDPKLRESGIAFLYIVPFSIGFMGLMNVSTHTFNALRKPAPALFLSIARLLVVYIPLAMLASHFYGYIGVFVATAATNVLMGVVAVLWSTIIIRRQRDQRIAASSTESI
ncbi:MAG: MATE family efflux transporter [Pseudomonadales bacterium]|nr:MATE family efflux transporter [Pseudomonadales bacterium]